MSSITSNSSEAGLMAYDSDTVVHSPGDNPGKAKARSRWITVEPTALLYVCFLAMSQPLTSQYVYSQVANAMNYTGHAPGEDEGNCTVLNTSSPEYTEQNAVQQESARWMIYLNIAQTVPSIFSTLLLTGYCDRVGRKVAMILPLLGVTIRSIVCLLVVFLKLHVGVLIAACLLEGLTGGPPCFFMALFSYLADVTTREQRTIRILVVELCLSTGAGLASIGGGYVIDALGFRYPFAISLGINVINIIYTYFLVPETIERVPGTKAISLSYCKDIVRVFRRRDAVSPSRSSKLMMCLVVLLFTNMVILGKSDCEVFHLLAAPFCWKSLFIGIFQATVLLVGTVSSLVGTGLLQRKIGDTGMMFAGCLSGVAYGVMFGLSNTTTLIFLTSLAGQWYHLVMTMVRSTCSKLVQPDEQGAMFAGISLVQVISVMAGLTGFDAIYQATVNVYPPTVFFVMAGGFLIGAVFALILMIQQTIEKKRGFNYGPVFNVNNS